MSASKIKARKHFRLACDIADDLEDFEKAIEELDKAIQLSPSATVCWTTKGHFYSELGKFKEAKKSFRTATKLAPERSLTWAGLGMAQMNLKEYKSAAQNFRKAVNLQPDFNLYTMLANVELTFDPKLALADAKKALKLEPNWDEALKVHKAAEQVIAKKGKGGRKI